MILGFLIAMVHMKTGSYTRSLVLTLAVMPVLVQMVIMMASGNLGTSVAVLGTFSLVRFRSVPGSAREIASIFYAMAVGLAMGQVFFGVIMAIIVGGWGLYYPPQFHSPGKEPKPGEAPDHPHLGEPGLYRYL
ncbi:DUF4956 domain-containing protein [Eubacterium aggregans]|uniref:DUF4956 domain-containing protein n=1 Tax=Eubacterium aggregans TaxID=81409 RepID=UPI003F2F7AFF